MRRVPGAPKGRPRSTIAPQHRMVFGLLVMASAAFVLSVAFRPGEGQDKATEPVPMVVVSRVPLRSPTPGEVTVGAVATDAVLDATVRELLAGLDACTRDHLDHFGDRGGELRVDLVLDSGGLREAELVGAHLPQARALDCVAAAVHGRPWPTVIGDPMALRVPFYVVLPLGEGPPGSDPTPPDGAPDNAGGTPENDDGPPPEGQAAGSD